MPAPRPRKLSDPEIDVWLGSHPDWVRAPAANGDAALVRTFRFDDFAAALGFVVRVGCAAEKRDHHPDVELGWGRARVFWTTHDAGGVTALDLELAETCTVLALGSGSKTGEGV